MKICFIPIDNRPVCYDLAKDIALIDTKTELLIPPVSFLGDLTKSADINALFDWLENLSEVDITILSLDTLAYGGLIPSRRSEDDFETVKRRMERLKPILSGKKNYAFSSIMRISNNNYNEEEKEYWAKYGTKIFKYSYNFHKFGKSSSDEIPKDILDDYIKTRERNFEINKMYLEWQKEGLFETLIFSKDDCAEYGLNVMEAQKLEEAGGKTKTGADEIPLSLLARSVKKDIKVYPLYLEQKFKDRVSNYEDVSIEKSVSGQLELSGFKEVTEIEDADLILVINNFIEKQGELVMGWETPQFTGKFIPPEKPYAAADVRYANGADNSFVNQLLNQINPEYFYGYAGWNTSANTLGSLLAGVKFKYGAENYNDEAFKNLQLVRFLDDWAYQANVRGMINSPEDISDLMKPFENRLSQVFQKDVNAYYSYPWNRKFEVKVSLC